MLSRGFDHQSKFSCFIQSSCNVVLLKYIMQPHPAIIPLISSLYSINHSDFIKKSTMREADAHVDGFILPRSQEETQTNC